MLAHTTHMGREKSWWNEKGKIDKEKRNKKHENNSAMTWESFNSFDLRIRDEQVYISRMVRTSSAIFDTCMGATLLGTMAWKVKNLNRWSILIEIKTNDEWLFIP